MTLHTTTRPVPASRSCVVWYWQNVGSVIDDLKAASSSADHTCPCTHELMIFDSRFFYLDEQYGSYCYANYKTSISRVR